MTFQERGRASKQARRLEGTRHPILASPFRKSGLQDEVHGDDQEISRRIDFRRMSGFHRQKEYFLYKFDLEMQFSSNKFNKIDYTKSENSSQGQSPRSAKADFENRVLC